MQLEIIRLSLPQGWGRSLGRQALLLAICLHATLAGFSSKVDFDDEDYPNYPTDPSFGLGGQPLFGTDFLQSIPLPFDNPQISYASGIDGYPAFLIESKTNIRTPAKTFFKTNKLSRDFSLLVTVQPHQQEGGILFAVVNPEQTLISFGLELGQAEGGKVNLTLYYQDHRYDAPFEPLVQFEVASFVGEWRKFAIRVEDDMVTLFYGCDDQQDIYEADVIRTTMELPLQEGSTLFVAQGGQLFGSHFVGAIQELKLFDEPERAAGHCKGNQIGYSGAGLLPEDGPYLNKGEKGDVGPKGDQGDPGPPGKAVLMTPPPFTPPPPLPGPRGLPGEKGQRGEKGDAGVPLDPEAEFTTNYYDNEEISGDFSFELGESVVGPPGAVGPQGEPGPPGEYLHGVEDSIEGSGEIEEETGPPGPQGEPGTDGKDGQPGERGPEGQKGEAGVRGPQGVQGEPGTRGLPGPGVSRVQLEQFCPAAISLQDVCRQLQPAKELRMLLNNPYRDLVPDGNPSTLVTKLQADLAAILTVDLSRLDNFQVSSGTSMLSFEVRPPTSLNQDSEPSVEDIVDLISTLVRTNMLDLQTAYGLRLEPDLTSYEVKDMTEVGQGSGSPGVPGLPGLPGLVGPRGDQGLPGQKGDTGDVGLTGGQGPKGEAGVSGATGPMGPQGYTGPPGPPGPPGIYQEIDGGSGEEDIDSGLGFVPGKPGPPGRPGTPGKHGSQGIKGDKGDQGPSGIDGLDGTTGASGPQGLPGVTGSPGVPGLPGSPGVTGPLGARGQKGDRGEPGYGQPGPPGPPGDIFTPDSGIDTLPFPTKGEKGENGSPGSKGDPGLPGLEGDPGLPGIMGPMGLKGETGETGQSVLVPVDEFGYPLLNVATLPSVKGQRGEPGQCTEECVTSVGPPGPQGPMGPQGQEGHPGVSGQRGLPGIMGEIGIPGLPANKGSRGYPGVRGQPGVGLKGEKGEMGYAGPPGRVTTVDGKTVVPGHKGERGHSGLPGKDGIRGLPGVQGYQGKEGVKGDKGSRGYAGRRGHRGDDGLPGAPGREGPLGRQGVPGTTGPKGEKGGQGPPGPPGTGGSDIGALVGVPGIKGEPGQPGRPGESIVGPPGPPGTAGDDYVYYNGLDNELDKNPPFIIGPRGPPGPPGPPGPKSDVGDKPDMPGMGGPVTFSSVRDMLSVSVSLPEATLAYIADTQTVYMRVRGGWKEVLLGSFVPLLVSTPQPVTGIVPTTRSPGVMSTAPTAVPMSTAPPANIPNPDIVGDGQPVLRLVAANEPFTGDIRGIKGADYICYKEAKLSGLQGTFRAFVTSRDQDLRSLVHERLDRELPIVNLRREKLFYNWDDIYNGSGAQYSKKTPLYSFDGRNVLIDPKWPKKMVWHGSDAKGNRKMKHSCHGWRSRRPDERALASSLLKGLLLEQTEYTCDHRFVLLCVEHVSNRFLR